MTQLYKTTELEAVNIMLSAIGEAPVSSLDNTSLEDVAVAVNILNETVVDVQSSGYHFNRDYNVALLPDTDGQINVGANVVSVDASPYGATQEVDVVLRGSKLYDRENQTFVFSETVYADLITILSWDDLPQTARRYITVKAARRYQARVFGSDTLNGFTAQDEADALVAMQQDDSRISDTNFLNSNWDVYRVLSRNGRRRYI